MNEWKESGMNKWMNGLGNLLINEQMDKYVNGWIIWWMKEWNNKLVDCCKNRWILRTDSWLNELINSWINKLIKDHEWIGEWMN